MGISKSLSLLPHLSLKLPAPNIKPRGKKSFLLLPSSLQLLSSPRSSHGERDPHTSSSFGTGLGPRHGTLQCHHPTVLQVYARSNPLCPCCPCPGTRCCCATFWCNWATLCVCTQHCPSTLPTPPCCCVPLSCSCPSLRGAAPQQVRFRTRWDPPGFNRGGFHCSQNPGAHLHCRICPTPPTPPPAGTALGFPPRELSSPTKNKRCSSNVCMGSTSRFIES